GAVGFPTPVASQESNRSRTRLRGSFFPMIPPRNVPPRRRRWFLALGVLILAGVSGGLFGLHWWTRHQLRTAEDLLADLRFEEAGRLLDDYLRIRPSAAKARLVAAQAKRRAGDPEAAEDHPHDF